MNRIATRLKVVSAFQQGRQHAIDNRALCDEDRRAYCHELLEQDTEEGRCDLQVHLWHLMFELCPKVDPPNYHNNDVGNWDKFYGFWEDTPTYDNGYADYMRGFIEGAIEIYRRLVAISNRRG